MSGRDLREFVNKHRSDRDRFLQKLLAGKGRVPTIPHVEYEQLQSEVQGFRAASGVTQSQVERTAKASQASRERWLQQQHSTYWWQEWERLALTWKQLCNDLIIIKVSLIAEEESSLSDAEEGNFFYEILSLESQLSDDRQEFHACTVQSVLNLADDIKKWLSRHGHILSSDQKSSISEPAVAIRKEVESVKRQQKKINENLRAEEEQLTEELRQLRWTNCSSSDFYLCCHEPMPTLCNHREQIGGLAKQVSEWLWPTVDQRQSAVGECIVLDRQYQHHLDLLNDLYQTVLRRPFGGFKQSEHEKFVWLIEEYEHAVQHRQMLVSDRLQRHFPLYSKKELSDHERWQISHVSYHQRLQAHIDSWRSARQRLLINMKASLVECLSLAQAAATESRQAAAQQEICQKLQAKLSILRRQREEELSLQAAIAAHKQAEEADHLLQQEEKNRRRHQAIKEKVATYNAKKRHEAELQCHRDEERLRELQANMAAEAEHARQRVKFREAELERKAATLRNKQQVKMEEEVQREKRLAALRAQVIVDVPEDPLRYRQPTQASASHEDTMCSDDVPLQQPLFDVKSFTDKQVLADPRFQVEAALRKAGLHQSEYARAILAQVQPAKQPRPDQASTVFKHDHRG